MAGTWVGEGTVLDNNMGYTETLTIEEVKKNDMMTLCQVNSKTHAKNEEKTPLHFECGLLKIMNKPGSEEGTQLVEGSFVHPFGMAEFEYGDFNAEAK